MVTICQQCGDEGITNAFIYCVECLDFAVHRYCLDNWAGNFDEFVLWFCEDCKPKAAKQSPLDKSSSSIPSRKTDYTSLKDAQVTHSRIKLKKKEVVGLVAETEEQICQSSPSQQPRESCTKLELTNPAQLAGNWSPLRIKLKKKKEQRLQSIPFQQPHESRTKHYLTERAWFVGNCSNLKTKLKKKKKKKGITRSVAETEEQRHQSTSFKQPREAHRKFSLTERAQLASDCSSLKIKLKNKKEDVTSSLAETEKQKSHIRTSQHPYEAHTKVNMSDCALWEGDCSPLKESRSVPQCIENRGNDLKLGKQRSSILEEWSKSGEEAESVRINAAQTGPNDLSNISDHNYHLRAKPVIDLIWRGSFSVCNRNYGLFDGVVAHLSSKACSKVWKEASLLPALLCPEMLPKKDVWPKSFERSEPSDENIALYFFAGNKSCERVFYRLVDDMICYELAMRAMVKNAELLLFASTELPLLYWRFQGNYYLWGVFREKQTSSSNPPNHHVMDSANDVGARDERDITKTKTGDTRSSLSPLSSGSSYGSGSL